MNQNPKVHLRALEPEDLDLLYRIENDVNLWHLGATNVPYSRYTLHDYIANASGDIYTDHQVRMMIEDVEGSVVGIADIVNFDAANRKAEVGVVVEVPHRRQGYAFDALQQLADYALSVLHLHQLYAVVDVSNKESLQLFRKLGYKESVHLHEWLFDGRNFSDAVMFQLVL